MFTAKKTDRQALFKKAMLSREKRPPLRRGTVEKPLRSSLLPAVCLWSSFGIVSGYMLFFSPALSVETVEVHGESILPLSEYETFSRRMLEGRHFSILPKNNFLLIPIRSIENELRQQYPKLSRVSVQRTFPSTVKIFVDEAPLLFQWCSGGPCYSVQGGKAAMLAAAEDPRYDEIRLSVIDESALPVAAGGDLQVDAYFFSFSFFFRELSSVLPTRVTNQATTPSRHSNELALTTDEGWLIRIATDRGAESSLRALQLFLDEYAKDHPDRSNLAWIDLRVEGKIFFADTLKPTEEIPSGQEKKKKENED